MKLIFGAGLVSICLALVIVMLVSARTHNLKPFVYESATTEEQTDWLYRQAKRYRRDIAGSLPNGWGWSPRLEVARIDVDSGARTINFLIEAREQGELVSNAQTIEYRWLKRVCRKFIHDTFYKTGVSIVDSFHLMNGRPVFQVVISPDRCDAIYPPTRRPSDAL
ncbi:MAG: hypothetical protein ACRBCJ_03330 [Hyphomicrobiaceae bacterium]